MLAELPPITEIEHQVELSREEALLYEAVRRAALDKLGPEGEGNKLVVLAELTRLRRLCCDARLVVPEATKGTIEERIVALHRTKRDLADSLLAESDQAAALTSAELRALLETWAYEGEN